MTSFSELKILIVDDMIDNLLLFQAVLESEGYQTEIVDNGNLALEMIRASPPDLILLDIMMPDINGYELTRIIRQDDELPPIPVILVTAHREADLEAGLRAGANDFLYKPVDVNELLTKVNTLCN